MKKTFYVLMAFVGMALTSCEPMEDIHDEIDNDLDSQLAVAERDYVLTEDDYEDLGQSFPNFGSVEDAGALIPTLLSDLYPTYGAGSIINVGFDLFDPLRVEDYMVTDYPGDANYFADTDAVADFLDSEFEGAEEGSYLSVTYNVVASDVSYSISNEEFDLIGERFDTIYPGPASAAARFSNFDRRTGGDNFWSDSMIYEAVAVVLNENVDGVTGQTYNVSYRIFTGSSGEENVTFVFDGNTFVRFMTTPAGEAYVIDENDITLIVSGLADESDLSSQVSNLDNFGNFNRQASSDNYWSDSDLAEAFTIVLNERFADAADGMVYVVEYDFFDGSSGTGNLAVIKDGDDYEIATAVSTIEDTNVFAYTNGNWGMPYMLPSESYTEEFGQRFSNFGDEEEALSKIGIFLGREFPYATEGEYKAVGYRFYNGEATVTEYANFVFEGGDWTAIPSVISTALQFGFEDGMWVPDNTINYMLTSSDYSIIADALSANTDLATQLASIDRYGNFDRRPGASAEWNDANLLLAMKALLNEIAPNAEEGQKYLLTFDIYNGSNTTESLSLIKEGGMWVVNQ